MATSNPFDTTLPNVDSATAATAASPNTGLINSAMSNPVTAPTTAGSTQNATAGTATAGTATGTGYTAKNADNTAWNVTAPQTVSGQLATDMDPSSQLMQKAQADAAQTANSRGLLNSAMAAGAGTSALLDKALQIATPDAATNANAAATNAASMNQTSQYNSGQTNAASAFTAGAANTASGQNAQAQTSVNEQNAGAQTQTSLANAQAANSAKQFDAGESVQAQTANQSAALSAATTQFQAATQVALQNASEADKVTTQKMVSDTQAAIENIDAQYKTQMQVSQSSQGMYSTAMQQMGQIMSDPNLDAGAKQNLINQQMEALKNGLNLQMGISNIDGVASLVSNLGSNVESTNTANPVAAAPAQNGLPPPPPAGVGGSNNDGFDAGGPR